MRRASTSSSGTQTGPVDELIAQGLDRYAKGDIDGALASWQQALSLAPDDSRALGYVDYVKGNYQLLQRSSPADEEFSDGSQLADESEITLIAAAEPARSFPTSQVDDGWVLGTDADAAVGHAQAQAGGHAGLGGAPVVQAGLGDDGNAEFSLPTPTVAANGQLPWTPSGAALPWQVPVVGVLPTSTSATQRRPAVTEPPDRPTIPIDEPPPPEAARQASVGRGRSGRATLSPGSVPPGQNMPRFTDPPLAVTPAPVAALGGDRFSKPTQPPVGDPSLLAKAEPARQMAATQPPPIAAPDFGFELPEESFAGIDLGESVAVVTQPLSEAPTGPMEVATLPEEAFGHMPQPNVFATADADYELELEVGRAPVAAPAKPERAATHPYGDMTLLERAMLTVGERLDAATAAIGGSERTRARVSWLLEHARSCRENGLSVEALASVELAHREDPDSVVAQKLLHGHAAALEQLLREFLGDAYAVPRMAVDVDRVMTRNLDPRGAFLLSRIDGMSSFDEIIDISGMPQLEALRYLSRFVVDRLITTAP